MLLTTLRTSQRAIPFWLLYPALLGLVSFHAAVGNAADNSIVTVSVTVSTWAKWVATPSAPQIPPYFAADLSTLTIQVQDVSGHPTLASKVQERLMARLRIMESRDVSELNAANLADNSLHDWVIVPNGTIPQQFPADSLLQRLISYDDPTISFLNRPNPGAIPTSERIILNVKLRVYPIDNITIVVGTSGTGNELTTMFPLSQLRPGIPRDTREAGIKVEVHHYLSSCEQPGRNEVAERIAKGVLPLYKSLYNLGLIADSFDLEHTFPQYKEAINKWLKTLDPVIPISAHWDPLKGQLQIKSVDTVYNVNILPTAGFEPLRARLARRACNDLVGLPLTSYGEGMFSYLAEQDPGVHSIASKYADGNLELTISPQPTFAKLNITGGPTYNNETGWTGKLSVVGQDLVPMRNFYYLGNALQASYNGGGDYQNATISEAVTKTSRDPMPKLDFYSFVVGGNFLQNQADRYGAEVPGQTLTVNETQATAGLKLSYDSFSIFDVSAVLNQSPSSRKVNRNQVVIPVNFMFEKFTASGNSSAYHTAGNILQFSTSPNYLFTHDFEQLGKTKGWSELDVEASAEYIKGVAAGGYVGFDRYLGSATVASFFGLRSTRQFLLRCEYGVGSLSKGGPIVRVFQLGGTQMVPGLQFGEVAGQTLAFGHAEAGIDVPSILALFKHPVPTDVTLLDIRRSYLELQYSRASVSQGESVRAVAGLSSGVESFGPAIELGRLKNQFDLTAGYMYSPQSALHTHGTFFLSVSVSDIRMR